MKKDLKNILEKDDDLSLRKEDRVKMPVLGSIPAGVEIDDIKETKDSLYISNKHIMSLVHDYFLYRVKDNSMEPKYLINDIVLFEKRQAPENGKDYMVRIGTKEGILRQYHKEGDIIELRPYNKEYETEKFTTNELMVYNVQFIGKARSLEYREL